MKQKNNVMNLRIKIPARGLFHFAIPCYFQDPLWNEEGAVLSERHRLPNLLQVDNISYRVEAYAGWNDKGFAMRFRVFDQLMVSRLESGSGGASISIWINTRAAQDIHRATRYCHWFEIQPMGNRKGDRQTRIVWRAIPKAREAPNALPPQSTQARVSVAPDMQSYITDVLFTREALTGFDPREHPRMGFNFEIKSPGHEAVSFSAGHPLPYGEDPSLWVTLDMVES